MPITARINRHPETETQSETAAPHPEEMEATFLQRRYYCLSVLSTTRASLKRAPEVVYAGELIWFGELLQHVPKIGRVHFGASDTGQ